MLSLGWQPYQNDHEDANGQFETGETHQLVIDTDVDGMTDGEEYQAGTNPNDPASIFVSAIEYLKGSNSITVNWTGMIGHRYSVWQVDDIGGTPPNWTLTATQNVAGTGGTMHYSESVSNAPPAKLFRIQVWRE